MKKVMAVLCIVTLFVITNIVYAGKPSPPPVVIEWPNGAAAAVTYTFDDCTANQLPVAVPILNSFNYKATFFVVTSWISDWSGWRNAGTQGHEIASHTVDHASLRGLSIQDQIYQYSTSKSTIENEIGKPCTTIAYPNCRSGDEATCAQYFIAGRNCSGSINSGSVNLYEVGAFICGSRGSIKTLSDFTGKDEAAATAGGWLVFLLHGIDNDGGYSPLSSTILRDSLQYLKNNQSRFWVATFADVANYIKQRQAAKVAEVATLDSSITIQVTSELNSDEFNFPITISKTLPEGWKSAKAVQNGEKVEVINGEDGTIMFSVVPNGGDVVLFKN